MIDMAWIKNVDSAIDETSQKNEGKRGRAEEKFEKNGLAHIWRIGKSNFDVQRTVAHSSHHLWWGTKNPYIRLRQRKFPLSPTEEKKQRILFLHFFFSSVICQRLCVRAAHWLGETHTRTQRNWHSSIVILKLKKKKNDEVPRDGVPGREQDEYACGVVLGRRREHAIHRQEFRSVRNS